MPLLFALTVSPCLCDPLVMAKRVDCHWIRIVLIITMDRVRHGIREPAGMVPSQNEWSRMAFLGTLTAWPQSDIGLPESLVWILLNPSELGRCDPMKRPPVFTS